MISFYFQNYVTDPMYCINNFSNFFLQIVDVLFINPFFFSNTLRFVLIINSYFRDRLPANYYYYFFSEIIYFRSLITNFYRESSCFCLNHPFFPVRRCVCQQILFSVIVLVLPRNSPLFSDVGRSVSRSVIRDKVEYMTVLSLCLSPSFSGKFSVSSES